MIRALVSFSITQRWLILFAVLGMAAFGAYNFLRLPIDAVPDITNVQVQINTAAPGYTPLEVERRITFPIETAMGGLPKLSYTRSLSRYGLSQVTVVFQDGTDIYFARQLVNERLQQAKDQLPQGLEAAMGPISTGLGEIYHYTVEAQKGARNPDGSPVALNDLRTLQDWVIKPQLRTVPGVVEVNTIGGYARQYHVLPRPEKLQAFGVSLHDLMEAIARNNSNVGAGYIERYGEQYLIRSPGQVQSIDDILDIAVAAHAGAAVRIRDVATVELGKELRSGAATHNGEEVVVGTAIMLIGENSRTVSQRVNAKIKEIAGSLGDGLFVRTIYDRTELVNKTIATVEKNLLEGAVLVVVVLFLFLGNFRAALIAASIIPLSMLFAISGMVENRISANLMSLGAIDFGIIVDGAVIVVENCLRLLAERQAHAGRLLDQHERFVTVRDATSEVVTPSLFGSFIIMVVYLPILTLTGVEGKMFTPMALTVILALTGAMILSVTFVPAAIALFVTGRVAEEENMFVRGARRLYAPCLRFVLRNRLAVTALAGVLVVLSGAGATRLGSEFIPRLDEGDVAAQALRPPGASLSQSIAMQSDLERRLLALPEVKEVFARTGTAEIATDAEPPSSSDGYVMIKPQEQWPDPSKTKARLVKEIQDALKELPGAAYEMSQPIQLRFNELIAGVRADVGVKVFGDDMDVLAQLANRIAGVLRETPGAADVRVEQISGLPMLTVNLDRPRLSRLGLNVADVQETIQIAAAGKTAGVLFDGDRRFEIVVRLPEDQRTNIDSLRLLPIPLPAARDDEDRLIAAAAPSHAGSVGRMPRFTRLAKSPRSRWPPARTGSAARTASVWSSSRPTCAARDLGSFVEDAQARIARGGQAADGLLDRVGRPVRTTHVGGETAFHRRARSPCC